MWWTKRTGRELSPACQRGQALVEFAVILPLLLLLLVTSIDIAYLTYQKVVLQIASRDAARALAVGAGYASAEAQANHDLAMGRIPPGNVQWDIEDRGDYVAVTLQFDRAMWIPGLPTLFGESPFARTIPLRAGATFRKRG